MCQEFKHPQAFVVYVSAKSQSRETKARRMKAWTDGGEGDEHDHDDEDDELVDHTTISSSFRSGECRHVSIGD